MSSRPRAAAAAPPDRMAACGGRRPRAVAARRGPGDELLNVGVGAGAGLGPGHGRGRRRDLLVMVLLLLLLTLPPLLLPLPLLLLPLPLLPPLPSSPLLSTGMTFPNSFAPSATALRSRPPLVNPSSIPSYTRRMRSTPSRRVPALVIL